MQAKGKWRTKSYHHASCNTLDYFFSYLMADLAAKEAVDSHTHDKCCPFQIVHTSLSFSWHEWPSRQYLQGFNSYARFFSPKRSCTWDIWSDNGFLCTKRIWYSQENEFEQQWQIRRFQLSPYLHPTQIESDFYPGSESKYGHRGLNRRSKSIGSAYSQANFRKEFDKTARWSRHHRHLLESSVKKVINS